MASYLMSSMSQGETLLARFEIHWTQWIPVWLLYAAIVTIPYAILQHLILRGMEFGVTNRRVVYKTGLISRHSEEMKLASIETVEIRQGMLGRLLGYGDVQVTGLGNSAVLFRSIRDPMSAKLAIENARHG